MKKHKRRKRYDRDWSKYQKYHREKKLKVRSGLYSLNFVLIAGRARVREENEVSSRGTEGIQCREVRGRDHWS